MEFAIVALLGYPGFGGLQAGQRAAGAETQ